MQLPPTPTPLPPATAMFEVDVSLWDSTDTALQYWNLLGAGQVVLQVMVIIFIVIVGIAIINRFAQQSMDKDSQD